jgi:2-polyprenyl-3-methyl-5-hydroxy-6-metoxy-1,4-benzoquinol methylase
LGVKDYSLNSGERQTATKLGGIRADHTARYRVAADFLKAYFAGQAVSGYDCFCGVGYGAYMLSEALPGASIVAIDGSADAVKLAEKHYQTGKIKFEHRLFPFELPEGSADFFVSLESIEHIEDDAAFLNKINKIFKMGGVFLLFLRQIQENGSRK